MSDSTIVIVVSSVQTFLLALLAAMVKIWSDRQTRNHTQTIGDIKVLKEQTDGKLAELTNAVKGQATAEGKLEGRADVRAEAKEDAKP